MGYRGKICGVVLEVLYRGIRILGKVDSEVKRDLSQLPPGVVIRISVTALEGPDLSFRVYGGVPEKTELPPDIHIIFKSEKMAFRVFTGRMSVAGAYAAHSFVLRGNINETMGVVRIIERVEGYLFPRFMGKRILKALPRRQYPVPLVYLRLLPGR